MTKQKIALRRAHNRPQSLDPVERINAITRNARASWAGLVAVLLFVGVTLLGFEHIDFYGIDEQTTLPVVGVSVPTRFFFYAAPVLAAASYIYFHLYLLRLWSALATAPARIKGAPLSDATPVWLLIDAALWLRNLVRRDGSSGERALEGISALVNIALAWGFGLVVVGYAWWISATARDLWMTGLTALMWLAMIATAISSLGTLWRRVAHNRSPRPAYIATATFFLCAPLVAFPSYWRTTEPAPWLPRPSEKVADDWHSPYPRIDPFAKLAPINLLGAEIVQRPDDWLPHDILMDEFRVEFCKRKSISPCEFNGESLGAFEVEWDIRWQAQIEALVKPDWSNSGRKKPDLRQANLTGAFLVGINLSGAELHGANLTGAQLQFADLREIRMQNAQLAHSRLQGVKIFRSRLRDTGFYAAHVKGGDFLRAQMTDANLDFAIIEGTKSRPIELHRLNLSNSTNMGGAVRFAKFTRTTFDRSTDWSNIFLDGSVELPDDFRTAMGDPCHWERKVLPDKQFYGRWRGWVEAGPLNWNWQYVAPPEWRDVTPIPPPEGCEWKFGLMPDAASK